MKVLKQLKYVFLTLFVAAAVLAPAVPAIAADDPFGGVCNMKTPSGGVDPSSSTVCQTPPGNALTTEEGIIHRFTVVVAIFTGVMAVVVIAIGGLRYITSAGDAEQIAQSKRTLIYAGIGLAVVSAGSAIISFVLRSI